jgi:hypothetical protein
MREIDLIPESYRRQRSQRLWTKLVSSAIAVIVLVTGTARVWLGSLVDAVEADVAALQARETVTQQQRDELTRLDAQQRSYLDQLNLLRGLRSGTAATNLFHIVDAALADDELWFRDWQFRRAGVRNAAGQSIETGYFVVVADDNRQQDAWQVETHMVIAGQAQDHGALSRFVTRLLAHPEIDSAGIRRSEQRRYGHRSLVDFDLAVVMNRKVLD